MSVEQNRRLRVNDADISIAEANQFSALGNEDLLIGAEANVTSRRAQPIEGAQFQDLEFINVHAEVSATKPLFYGGRIGLAAIADYNRRNTRVVVMGMDLGESVTEAWTPSLRLTYFMPLLRGFGETSMRAGRLRAAAQTDIARLELANSVAGVIRDTILAYWEVVYAKQEVEIRRSSLELAREQLRITQARLDVGVGSPTDVAAVRQGIATRESELLLAELAVSERALDLRQLVGMDIAPTDIALEAADKLEVTTRPIDLAAAFEAAYANNPQIASLAAQGRAATIEIEIADDNLRPRLDLNASFGPAGTAGSISTALDRAVKLKDYELFAGLTFELPVGNHTARGAYRAAVGQRIRVQVNEDDLRRVTAVSVTRAVNLLRSTEKRMQVDAEATQLAQINLDAEKARFEVGRTTNFEVLRRVDDLSLSRLRQSRDAADYVKAVAGLQTLTGELLPSYGIKVTPRPTLPGEQPAQQPAQQPVPGGAAPSQPTATPPATPPGG